MWYLKTSYYEEFVKIFTTVLVIFLKIHFDIREFPMFGKGVVWMLIMSYLSCTNRLLKKVTNVFIQLKNVISENFLFWGVCKIFHYSSCHIFENTFPMFGKRVVWILIMSYLSCKNRFPYFWKYILIFANFQFLQRGLYGSW